MRAGSVQGGDDAATILPALRWPTAVACALFVASLAGAIVHVSHQPQWNLDGLFYSALMVPKHRSRGAVHARVYAAVARDVPTAAATALIDGSRYRRTLRDSAPAFATQLPFYTNKPLYRALGRGLAWAGVSLVAAPYVVSTIGFALLGDLLPVLAIRAGAGSVGAFGASALAVWLPQLRELGELATPDALAAALFVCGTAISLVHIRIAALPLTAAVAARPDVAILALGVLGAAWLRAQTGRARRDLLAVALLLGFVAILVQQLSGAYGWSAIMRHTFIERLLDRAAAHRGLSFDEYTLALGRGLRGDMTDHPARLVPYLMLAGLAWATAVRRGLDETSRAAAVLLAAVWFATAVRFFAIPILADRFFAPAYVCTLALSAALIAPRRTPFTTPP